MPSQNSFIADKVFTSAWNINEGNKSTPQIPAAIYNKGYANTDRFARNPPSVGAKTIMTIFGIAQPVSEQDGPARWNVLHIIPQGSYSTGDLPPFFKKKKDAEQWIKNHHMFPAPTILELNLL